MTSIHRLGYSALLFGLIAAPAGAAGPMQFSPVMNVAPAQHRMLHPLAAPAALRPDQIAAAVKANLNLAYVPALSGPFTVTPAVPKAPRAGAVFYSGHVDETGINMDDPSDPGYAHFSWQPGEPAEVRLSYHADAGKHYAFDCMIQTDLAITYSVYQNNFFSGPIFASGTAAAGPGHHVVFATAPVPQSGIVTTYIDFNNNVAGSAYFWGCNVSSF